MIAPAMNTRPQEALSYRDLARQKAQISRQIGLNALPRLKALVDALDAADVQTARGDGNDIPADLLFEVDLRFGLDARGVSRVEGEVSGQVPLNCNGCAEILAFPMLLTFACVIAETEAIADGLLEEGRLSAEASPADDVLVANGAEVTVAQIVEDEILLNLPERLCASEPCERAPELAYPAPGEGSDEQVAARTDSKGDASPEKEDNPFSVLADLKIGGSQDEER